MSVVPGIMAEMPTPTTSELLAFEARHPGHSGEKQLAIQSELGVPVARYYQLLNRAIETPSAVEIDAVLVHRLLRVQANAESVRRRRAG
ncbi:DUF3263 domain-containing protein [Microbacterium oleivorans]|uniref:DUF3263 domain-containing protein n=1 Tax=Microbacterium oleivorans TaxID=273677 RepID=UPI0034336FE6